MQATDKYNLEGLTTDAGDIAEIMIENYFRQGHIVPGLNDCEYANGIRDTATNESFLNAQGFFKMQWEELSQDNLPADDEDVCLWVLFRDDDPEPHIPYIGTYAGSQQFSKTGGYRSHTHFMKIPTKTA